MLNGYSSNAILTKVHAIFGKRLTPADFSQMARKTCVGEVATLLKENPSYQKALKNISETNVHRGQLESLLKRDIFYKYASLRRYDFSDNTFYNFIITKLEVDEILRCIMLMNMGQMEDFILDMPSYMLEHTSFDLMMLAKVTTFEQLLACLAGTPYAPILRKVRKEEQKTDYLRCESVLYDFYYTYLLQSVDKHFRGEARKNLRDIMMSEIEAHNMEIIFRLKRFYKMEADKIKPLLFHFSLNEDKIEKLFAADTIEEMVKVSGIHWTQPQGKTIPEGFVELVTHSFCYDVYKKRMHFTTQAPVAMYTFLALRNIEVQNIITVIEGVRYGQPQNEILSLLVL